jgi:hypothetical protein
MQKGHPRVAFLHLYSWREKQSPCGLCAGDSKAVALLGAAGLRDVAESPSLRQEYKCKKGHPRVAFLHLFHGGEKQSPCG